MLRRTRLGEVADSKGMKCKYIAQVVGVNPPHLSQIARGIRPAPVGFWERAAGLLRVSPEEIKPIVQLSPAAEAEAVA